MCVHFRPFLDFWDPHTPMIRVTRTLSVPFFVPVSMYRETIALNDNLLHSRKSIAYLTLVSFFLVWYHCDGP